MKIETYLPIFSGFYNTIWQMDYSYIENFIKEERKEKRLFSEIDFGDLEINFKQYERDIIESLCEVVSNKMNTFINSIKLQEINNPKTYNFTNDSADILIDVNIDEIKYFIYKHKDKFKEYLKNRYTSCDGFISHYSNDFELWKSDTKDFQDFSINGHYLGSILDFIANIIKINEIDLYEDVIENICILEYVINLDDIINYTDNSLFEFFTKNGYAEEIALYYVNCYENNVLSDICLNEKTLSIIREYEEKQKNK